MRKKIATNLVKFSLGHSMDFCRLTNRSTRYSRKRPVEFKRLKQSELWHYKQLDFFAEQLGGPWAHSLFLATAFETEITIFESR